MLEKSLKIGNVSFKNPVITASGTFGLEEFQDFLDYSKLGGITLKTITFFPRSGNTPPRILEVPCGLLNSIGLENPGFKSFYKNLKEEDFLAKCPTNVILSIAGDSEEELSIMLEAFSEFESIDIFEINLSCPNVHENGKTSDSNPAVIERFVKLASKKSKKPFTVKLSPQHNLITNSKIAEDMGANALTISNTFPATAIDIKRKKFYFENKVAGYSGPAVKPIALWNVYQVAKNVRIPIIASGGICSVEDAIEFLIAGASFVSIGTMNFIEPKIAEEISEKLGDYSRIKGDEL